MALGNFFRSEKELTPSEISALTGVSPDVQRDWRRHGHMGAIGSQNVKGRWVYDYEDAYWLYVMRRLSLGGIDLSLTFTFTTSILGFVSVWADAMIDEKRPNAGRYAMIRYHADRDHGPKANAYSMKIVQQISDDMSADDELFTVIDLKAIARGLPHVFRELFLEIRSHILQNGNRDQEGLDD